MALPKYATVVDGVVDVVSYYPDKDEAGNVQPPWFLVPEEIYGGFLQQPDGSFVAPEAPQMPDPVPEEISRRQFCQGLAVAGKITKAEAIAFIKGVHLPSAIQAIVDGMADEEASFEATMLLLGAGSFFRSHPLVLIFAMAQSMTETEVDDFWRLCAAL